MILNRCYSASRLTRACGSWLNRSLGLTTTVFTCYTWHTVYYMFSIDERDKNGLRDGRLHLFHATALELGEELQITVADVA